MSDFTLGLILGLVICGAAVLFYRARQALTRAERFAERFMSCEPMTHDQLFSFVVDRLPYVDLSIEQARELVDEHVKLEEMFEEAMTRKAELHTELEQVKRVANDQALEAAHCRACCDELRAKLDAVEARA